MVLKLSQSLPVLHFVHWQDCLKHDHSRSDSRNKIDFFKKLLVQGISNQKRVCAWDGAQEYFISVCFGHLGVLQGTVEPKHSIQGREWITQCLRGWGELV